MSLVLALSGGATLEAAGRVAELLEVAVDQLETRRFPDGESLVRVPRCAPTTILYGSLDHPDRKLVCLLLAAAALRALGARRLVLVAPYLCYMRQDRAFRSGEAISQRVVGGLLAERFDRIVTVDPHLHRISRLAEALPGIEADALAAAPLLADALGSATMVPPLVVGPDDESRSWVEAVAGRRNLDMTVAVKKRAGDRSVEIELPDPDRVRGRRVVIVDDIVSSGATIVRLAQVLQNAGASSVEAMVTHCLASHDDLRTLREAGVSRIVATDSVAGADGLDEVIALAPLLARSLMKEIVP